MPIQYEGDPAFDQGLAMCRHLMASQSAAMGFAIPDERVVAMCKFFHIQFAVEAKLQDMESVRQWIVSKLIARLPAETIESVVRDLEDELNHQEAGK